MIKGHYVYTESINRLERGLSNKLQDIIDTSLGDVFPALSATVIYKGRIILDAGWGWIDPTSHQIPVLPDAVFDLASLTKLFTETAALSLISGGKLELDDRLVDYVPEFCETTPRPMDAGQDPNSKAMYPVPDDLYNQQVEPERITIQHLLNHTSGIAPWRTIYLEIGTPPTPPGVPDPVSREERWQKTIQIISHYPFVDQPGNAVHYSDLAIMMLGEVVSRVHGVPGQLDRVIRDLVVAPLGLDSIGFQPLQNGTNRNKIPPTENDMQWRQRRCWGEVHDDNASGAGGIAGHAGLFGSALDMALFGQAWLERDKRLQIERELMDKATTYQVGGGDTFRIGYGWMLRALEGSSAGDIFSVDTYGHTGFTGTSLWIDPHHDLVIACFTNRVYEGREKPGIHQFRQAFHNTLAGGLYQE